MASPLKSPFKSIANCVKRVLDWNTSTSPTKQEYTVTEIKECKVKLVRTPIKVTKSRSRSVSPEIPKLEEPTQYVLKGEDFTDENVDPNNKRRTTKRNRSQASTPSSVDKPKSKRTCRREVDVDAEKEARKMREMKKLQIDAEEGLLTSPSTSKSSRRASASKTNKALETIEDELPEEKVASEVSPKSKILKKLQIDANPGLLTSASSPKSSRRASAARAMTPQKLVATPKKASSKQNTPLKRSNNLEDDEVVVRQSSRIKTESVPSTPKSERKVATPSSKVKRASSRNVTPAKSKNFVDSDSDDFVSPVKSSRKTPSSTAKRMSARKKIDLDKELKLNDKKSSPKVQTPNSKLVPAKPRSSRKRLNYKEDKSDISSDSGSDKDFKPKGKHEESDDSDVDDEEEQKPKRGTKSAVMTPKRKKTSLPSTPSAKDTPTRRRRSMVPRFPNRSVPLPKDISSLEEAQLRLHVAAVPDSLPCREDEFAEILSFTEGKISEGSSGCMYISGVPGNFVLIYSYSSEIKKNKWRS